MKIPIAHSRRFQGWIGAYAGFLIAGGAGIAATWPGGPLENYSIPTRVIVGALIGAASGALLGCNNADRSRAQAHTRAAVEPQEPEEFPHFPARDAIAAPKNSRPGLLTFSLRTLLAVPLMVAFAIVAIGETLLGHHPLGVMILAYESIFAIPLVAKSLLVLVGLPAGWPGARVALPWIVMATISWAIALVMTFVWSAVTYQHVPGSF